MILLMVVLVLIKFLVIKVQRYTPSFPDIFSQALLGTDETSKDFISGGSGDDVLIDLSNKTGQGEVLMLGGSGDDVITTASDREIHP